MNNFVSFKGIFNVFKYLRTLSTVRKKQASADMTVATVQRKVIHSTYFVHGADVWNSAGRGFADFWPCVGTSRRRLTGSKGNSPCARFCQSAQASGKVQGRAGVGAGQRETVREKRLNHFHHIKVSSLCPQFVRTLSSVINRAVARMVAGFR
jgi:hypothetical protein